MKTFILLFSLSLSFQVYALDSDSSDSLKRTQEMLRNHKKRMKAVNSSSKGKAAHEKVKNMFGSTGNVDNAYEMAAQMMGVITKEAGGDSKKMQEILDKGMLDPASLAERMPSEFKQMLKNAAGDVEKQRGPRRH